MAKKSSKKKPKEVKKEPMQIKSSIPSGEILMIIVLFASFILIAVSKCNSAKKSMEDTEVVNTKSETVDTIVLVETNSIDKRKSIDTTSIIISTPMINHSSLFVTIDSLKLRSGPHLDSMIIAKLLINEHVLYLNEITDFTQEINLGLKLYDEPWIKIKTQKGKIGWSYGAGLNYYITKNKK